MKKGEKLMKDQGLIGDFFCGAGGASVGIEEALGRSVDFAVNHDQTAIKLHSRNHPGTYHMTEDIFTADVRILARRRVRHLVRLAFVCFHTLYIIMRRRSDQK